MSGLPPPPGNLPPPPGWPASSPQGTPPAWPGQDRYAAPAPGGSPGGGTTALLVIGGCVAGLVVGALLVLAVVSSRSSPADDERTSSPTEQAEHAAPTATTKPPALAIPPLEHDLDLFGPAGTCVTAGTYANVPCEQDHAGEVFVRLTVPGEQFPGADTIQAEHAASCEGEFLTLAGESSAQAGLAVIGSQPSNAAWDNGLHDVVCIAMSLSGEPNVGSIADGG